MEFFVQAVNVLKILVIAVGAGLGAWGVINLIVNGCFYSIYNARTFYEVKDFLVLWIECLKS